MNCDWLILRASLGTHSSLVDYLAQVILAKNCPTTLHFSISMGSYDGPSITHFFRKGPPFGQRKFK